MTFRTRFSDGSPDHTSPHRPGYRFADCDARDAAEDAYRERSRRLHNADHARQFDPPHDATLRFADASALDELQGAARDAYERRRERLASKWRSGSRPDEPHETPFERRTRRRLAEQRKYDV
jgi:hypothetical protein